jgi:hypothetical protein
LIIKYANATNVMAFVSYNVSMNHVQNTEWPHHPPLSAGIQHKTVGVRSPECIPNQRSVLRQVNYQ